MIISKGITIDGICISSPGQIDTTRGIILHASSHIESYSNLDLKDILEQKLDINVNIENDVNCSGLAESWQGIGKDINSLFYLSVGFGVGGSYILDYKLHHGHSFSSGEIAYLPVNNKSYEQLVSTYNLKKELINLLAYKHDDITIDQIVSMYQNNNQIVIKTIDKYIDNLATGLCMIIYLINPEMIVVGGDLKKQNVFFQELLDQSLKIKLNIQQYQNTKLIIPDNLQFSRLIGSLRSFLLNESQKPQRDFINIIKDNKHLLTKSENEVAKYILNNVERIPSITISDLALQSDVSQPTITRFTKKIGLDSFNELKLYLSSVDALKNTYRYNANNSFDIQSSYQESLTLINQQIRNSNTHDFIKRLIIKQNIIFLVPELPSSYITYKTLFYDYNKYLSFEIIDETTFLQLEKYQENDYLVVFLDDSTNINLLNSINNKQVFCFNNPQKVLDSKNSIYLDKLITQHRILAINYILDLIIKELNNENN